MDHALLAVALTPTTADLTSGGSVILRASDLSSAIHVDYLSSSLRRCYLNRRPFGKTTARTC
ncbi:hypothetical protein [Thiorhodovibrio frisius]|uniref:hypothetical protein n=1 Tax=Thiorhodovibrio frisius TaxID=631362 RepID=UPI000255E727|nr:hypothetical protein [Thiorhodovibrio frisius]